MDNPLNRIKIISTIIICLLITACERPATISNWSPITSTQTLPTDDILTLIPNPETDIPDVSTPMEVISTSTLIPPFNLDNLPETLPHLLKGYELLSWESGEEWNFTLISGTNRQKTFEELVSPESIITEEGYVKITVSGLEDIKRVLELIPSGESIAWSGMSLTGQVPSGTIYFSYPPQEIMDELFMLANERGFDLYTLQESE